MTNYAMLAETGKLAGQSWAKRRDDVFLLMVDCFLNPEDHWKAHTTYQGLGAKRRLYMKRDKR